MPISGKVAFFPRTGHRCRARRDAKLAEGAGSEARAGKNENEMKDAKWGRGCSGKVSPETGR